MARRDTKHAWLVRLFFGVAGATALTLGIIGIFLPLLPTTPFVLLSAACFAKSSPRVEQWLISHKRFGPMILGWRERGAIPVRAKIAACVGMGIGFAVFVALSSPPYWLIGVVFVVLACVAAFILTRPD